MDPSIRTYWTSSQVNIGFTERINATTPAPIGHAAEVPEKGVQLLKVKKVATKWRNKGNTLVEVHQRKVSR